MKKATIFSNLISVTIFTIAWLCFSGTSQTLWQLICFQLIILWLSNEVWQRVISLPSVFGIIAGLAGRIKPEKVAKIGGIFYRLSSLTLLLIPHVFYALIFGVELLTDGWLHQTTGITYTHSLFAVSWCSVAVLWLTAQFCRIEPLSLSNLFTNPFNLKNIAEKVYEARQNNKPIISNTTPVEIATEDIDLHQQHTEKLRYLLQADEKLLHTARPNLSVNAPHMRKAVQMAWVTGVVSLLLLSFCVQLFLQMQDSSYWWAIGMFGALGLIFGVSTLWVLRLPEQWKRKLSQAGYAVTNQRIFIFENEAVQAFTLSEKLYIHCEMNQGNIGNIYICRPGLTDALAGLVLGKFAQQTPDSVVPEPNLTHPLPGFINCPDAEKVHTLIQSLRSLNIRLPEQNKKLEIG